MTTRTIPFRQAAPEDLTQLRLEERNALRDYLDRLRSRFAARIRHVILYGSRARGEGDDESDLDVLVVVDDGDWRFRREVALESFEPSIEHSALISPMIMNDQEFAQLRAWGLLFYRNLKHDGVMLWTETQKPH